jgi:hypothetical protein
MHQAFDYFDSIGPGTTGKTISRSYGKSIILYKFIILKLGKMDKNMKKNNSKTRFK